MSKLAKLQKKSAEQIFREEMKRRESINPDSYIVEGDPDITLKKEDVGDGKCCFVMPEMNIVCQSLRMSIVLYCIWQKKPE